nr:MAG TPA: hypothetical protein [Caudoviricetes sp.]
MSERNRDKVKRLEHEIGRYQKKVGELMEANAKLRKDVEGLNQLRAAFDAWIIQIALAYGEAVKDPDTGEDIPRMKALRLERPKVNPLLGKYEIHQRVDEKNVMHIAVGLRDDPADSRKETTANAPESTQERSEDEKREITPQEDENAQSASQGDLREADDGTDVG